jgi:hypothetical protein
LEGKSGGLQLPLLTPEIVGHREVLYRLVEYLFHDGQVPARQPGSGEAKASQCYVNPEQSYREAIRG